MISIYQNILRIALGLWVQMKINLKKLFFHLTLSRGNTLNPYPLHESQEILIDTEDELRIKLTLYITHDFYMELLSMGEDVKVIRTSKPDKKIEDYLL